MCATKAHYVVIEQHTAWCFSFIFRFISISFKHKYPVSILQIIAINADLNLLQECCVPYTAHELQ